MKKNVKVKGKGKIKVSKDKNINMPIKEVILMNKIMAKSEDIIEILERQLNRAVTERDYYKTLLDGDGYKYVFK